jgi:hypothetical protein
MRAATVTVKEKAPTVTTREGLWLELFLTLAGRNFVRAVTLARELGIEEERIKRLQRDALKQFLAEYRNFPGASKLVAEYGFTATELQELSEELLRREVLSKERTFAWHAGKPTTLSVADQIRNFVRQQSEALRRREGHNAAVWWKNLAATVRAWLDQFSTPWRGHFPHGGLASG